VIYKTVGKIRVKLLKSQRTNSLKFIGDNQAEKLIKKDYVYHPYSEGSKGLGDRLNSGTQSKLHIFPASISQLKPAMNMLLNILGISEGHPTDNVIHPRISSQQQIQRNHLTMQFSFHVDVLT
jgi:hypothetical protein